MPQQRSLCGVVDDNVGCRSYGQSGPAVENHSLVLQRPPDELVFAALRDSFYKNLEAAPDIAAVRLQRQLSLQGYHTVQAFDLDIFRNVVGHSPRSQCSGSFAVFEHESRVETDLTHERQCFEKVLFALIVESGEKIRCDRNLGNSPAQGLDAVEIPAAGIFAVHCLQNLVGTALNRQVDMAADVTVGGYRSDNPVGHILGMRRSETDSHIGSRLGHSRQQGGEVHIAESVGVDILSQQSDLPEATAAEVFDLGENASRLARTLAAAGIRDNTVAAKVIAATHYADETADTVSGYAGRNYIAIGLGSAQLDIDRLMARLGSSEQSGQIEIGIGGIAVN